MAETTETTETTEIVQINQDNVDTVLQEIHEAFWDIPFENSDFQTVNFVYASQITPERAYRALGLRINSKLQALNEAKYGRMKEDIDIEELEAKIANPDTSSWDRRRAEIDIQQKREGRRFTDKLINDALHELNVLYGLYKNLPKYNRVEFENGEKQHFAERLKRQVDGLAGAYESLMNMNNDIQRLTTFVDEYKKLT